MRSVIVTVGTSLLTNDDRGEAPALRRPWAGWRRGDPPPAPETMAAFLERADPQAACAETNTLRALPLLPGDALVWLVSQTDDGRRCGEALRHVYERRGFRSAVREIGGLRFHEEEFAEAGLKALVAALFEEIGAAQRARLQPVLCATGGFKAEIALVNLTGMLLGIEVYYIHELFRQLIQFPAFPIAWDLSVVERNLGLFEWIEDEPRPSRQVESRLHQAPELRPFVADAPDGNSYLTAAGDLLYGAFRASSQQLPAALWPPAADRQPSEKDGVSRVPHHRPEGWEPFVARLCAIDCVASVRYDPAAFAVASRGADVLDPAAGQIGVVYGAGSGKDLPLAVETTARGEEQTGLVAGYIRRRLRL